MLGVVIASTVSPNKSRSAAFRCLVIHQHDQVCLGEVSPDWYGETRLSQFMLGHRPLRPGRLVVTNPWGLVSITSGLPTTRPVASRFPVGVSVMVSFARWRLVVRPSVYLLR
jgi:hypothetical protein